jgi:hypothetical protein
MEPASPPPPEPSTDPIVPAGLKTVGIALAAIVIVVAAAIAGYVLSRPKTKTHVSTKTPSTESSPFFMGGVPGYAVRTPPTVAADKARLQDEDRVLGVSLGGRHRAYLIRAIATNPKSNVVADLLGDVPVTVTFGPRLRLAKVITGDQRGQPLDVVFGGYDRRHLLIRVGKTSYYQDSLAPVEPDGAPFPYREVKAEETTWKAWRQAHPDTDVYEGTQG